MSLSALAIHLLLFFPFGNEGYTSRSWDWVIWFGDCQKECDYKEGGLYTCANKRRSEFHCSCWNCQRLCDIREARVDSDYCDAAASHAAQVGFDVDEHLASLTADLTIDLVGEIPVVGGIASPILSFGKGLFEMGDDEQLLNSVIDDVNARLDTMNKCMGQQIAKVQVEDQVNSMERAFYRYDLARSHQGNANDDGLDKLRSAWEEHALVVHSEFDDVARSADFFGKLLLPMQDFAQSFILVSFDYLIYLHEEDEVNYEDAYERTIKKFGQLRTWADKARDVIKSSISNTMHALPCRNGDTIAVQMSNWNRRFLSTNVYPIDSYIDRLVELDKVLRPSFSWLGCYKDTQDRAMHRVKLGVKTVDECYDLCRQSGYYLFGLQNPTGGECFCSSDKDEATQFGESDKCDERGRGGGWALDIYQMNGIVIGNVELQYGVVYAIKSVSSGFYLDGRNQNYNNPVLTNRNPEGDKYLHWTIVPTNVENQFALKSVSSGFYLNGRDQNYNNPLITNRDSTNDVRLQWMFQKTNGGANNVAIKSVSSQFYLDGRNPDYSNPLLTNSNPMDDQHLQWQFIAQ